MYEAFSYNGIETNYRFETLEDVVRANWRIFLYGLDYYPNFRVIDNYDRQRVPMDQLMSVFNRLRRENWERYYYRNIGKYEFRNGPVPGIRSHYRGVGDRHPRTLQERRENIAAQLDEDVIDYKIRIRGNRKKLPTNWDDIPRADQDQRNWKNYRRTQYKTQE